MYVHVFIILFAYTYKVNNYVYVNFASKVYSWQFTILESHLEKSTPFQQHNYSMEITVPIRYKL